MGIYYEDPMVTLYQGDVRAVLRELPAESVQTVVTSPPYWSLRDYGIEPSVWGGGAECAHEWSESGRATAGRNDSGEQREGFHGQIAGYGGPREVSTGSACLRCGAWRGALGLEPTPELFITHMVEVFREVKRVLRRDGTLWLNIGDSYAASGPAGGPGKQYTNVGSIDVPVRKPTVGLKPKDLVGIPWMLAFALRADGWWLRQDIIWAKPNPMPESVTDRCTKAHEYVFLLSKSATYYYDADAIRESAEYGRREWMGGADAVLASAGGGRASSYVKGSDPEAGRNKRSVWTIATEPFPEAHFATYPQAIVRPCLLAGTSERGACATCGAPWERVVETDDPNGRLGKAYNDHTEDMTKGLRGVPPGNGAPTSVTTGWRPTCAHTDAPTVPCTVLDPFSGSGTTALVAKALGRRAVGIDLNAEYLAMSRKRIERVTLPMVLGAV